MIEYFQSVFNAVGSIALAELISVPFAVLAGYLQFRLDRELMEELKK